MRLAAAAALAGLAAAGPAAGAVEIDRGDLRAELSAQLRALYQLTRAFDAEDLLREGRSTRRDSWSLLSRARFEGELAWRDRVYAEVIYDVEGRTGTGLDTLRFAVADAIGTGTWLDGDRVFSRHADGDWRHLVYRAWVRYESERFELTLGRQRIPLGRGRLWNPSDLFNPIPPLAIEGQQRIGQDAVMARWKAGEGLWGSLIWSPMDDPDDHRAALRVELTRPELDAAGFVGRFARDWVFGLDFARNLGDAAVRGEATYTDLERGGRIWQVVASLDYTFPVGSGLYTLVEHLYNENLVRPLRLGAPVPAASPEAAVRQLVGAQLPLLDRIATTVRNQTGFMASYELTPLLNGSLLAIYDWHGPSAALFPVLAYSATSNLQLSVGAQLFIGPRGRSEYGDAANLLFLQLNYFF